MSVCAILHVRDEADIIEATVRHLLYHCDEVWVEDHLSVDGTTELLERLPVTLRHDRDRGFRQGERATAMAWGALAAGHEWVVPADADEIWHPLALPDERISDVLGRLDEKVMVIRAGMLDHVPTGEDDPTVGCPVRRIRWRQTQASGYKVACRLRPCMRIRDGNHGVDYAPEDAGPVENRRLAIRHFTLRSPAQTLRKVRNGLDAFSPAAGMPDGADAGWWPWQGLTDEQVIERFHVEFWAANPRAAGLVLDPAPLQEHL